jgi:hypothetical protein
VSNTGSSVSPWNPNTHPIKPQESLLDRGEDVGGGLESGKKSGFLLNASAAELCVPGMCVMRERERFTGDPVPYLGTPFYHEKSN